MRVTFHSGQLDGSLIKKLIFSLEKHIPWIFFKSPCNKKITLNIQCLIYLEK